ncbi:MAG: peptidoglycan-binding domain-containing protein, partial [Saprospiraceae bacterium]
TPAPTAQKVAAPAAPRIRSNVKRTSALDLQKLLKAEGYYKGSLDGYYGNGTAAAYDGMLKNSRELQKYLVLANNTPKTGTATSALQNALNELPNDAAAIATIRTSKAPIAKAYQAYYNFLLNGPGAEVNNLMNTAIREAFVGKKLPTPVPFDFRATYAYTDLVQLLLHVHYLHSLPDNDLSAPCWLGQRHPKEMKAMFERYVTTASLEYPLKACDQFLNWDEVKLLNTIAMDLNSSKKINAQELNEAGALRTMLYFAPKAISAADVKDTEAWKTKLLAGLDKWGATDPLNKQAVTAFKAAFYQSQVRLEDFYQDKGFKADAAENLALVTLRTLVEYHLERFV